MNETNKKPHVHVAAGIIWRRGRVLIAKRPKGSHLEGLWEFPGGKQEEGESLRGCLEREIQEELGLKVKADHGFLSVDHDYGSRRISLHFFTCIRLAGEPTALQGQQIRWVEPAHLPRFDFPPPDEKAVELLSTRGQTLAGLSEGVEQGEEGGSGE